MASAISLRAFARASHDAQHKVSEIRREAAGAAGVVLLWAVPAWRPGAESAVSGSEGRGASCYHDGLPFTFHSLDLSDLAVYCKQNMFLRSEGFPVIDDYWSSAKHVFRTSLQQK